MAIFNNISQCRTLTHLYLFKEKTGVIDNNNNFQSIVVLKIYDISQKCLSKTIFSHGQFEITPLYFSIADPSTLLETLIQKKLIASESAPAGATIEECIKDVEQIITQEKAKIVIERKELENLICPITHEVFKAPVIDNHGHTFEKSAIEEHRSKNNNNCPLNRQPITTLTPNLDIKRIIEEAQQKDPIPTFALFKKDNPKLAASSLETAQNYIEANEYDDALKAYAQAFQYTRAWTDYQKLPLLFAQMKQQDKASLAILYLIQYQLQDEKVIEALKILEELRKSSPELLQINFLLIKLYQFTKQPQKALTFAIESAELLAREHPQNAIAVYKQIIAADPHNFKVYTLLAPLIKDLREKAHILLKGACHAIQKKEYSTAITLCQKAENSYQDSFIDRLIDLKLLAKQNLPIQEKLLQMATLYEKKNLPNLMIKAYRALLTHSKDLTYYEKIIIGYHQIDKPEKALQWTLRYLTILIERAEWEQAEKVSLQAIKRTKKKIPLYEQQEIIYTNWNNHQLNDLLPKLGQEYLQNGQLAQAEKTYQKAYKQFNTFESAIALADILIKQDKKALGVQTYYQASSNALLENRLEDLSLCAKSIKQIDPKMEHLELSQRMILLTQSHLIELSNKVKFLEAKIEQQTAIAFGAAKWAEYFGDVGIEPPLPSDIDTILASRCPFFPGKTVRETHLLTLIPKKVGGKLLTLNSLNELVQKPKKGSANKYTYYLDEIKKEHGDTPIKESYWVLLTKDVIPNSRCKSCDDQKQLVEAKVLYRLPLLLEAATSILMEHVQSGTCLYSESVGTYTRCQERDSKYPNYPLLVGYLTPAGLCVTNGNRNDGSYGVGGLRKL